MSENHPAAVGAPMGSEALGSGRAQRGRSAGRRPALSPARVSAEIGITSLVVGALLGVAWYLLSPRIVGVVAEQGIELTVQEVRRLFDRVAIFTLLAAGSGVVLGLFFGARHRRRPVTAVLALAAGGLAGSLLALGVGVWLGPSNGSRPAGTEVAVPMELDAPAALVVWPVVSIIVLTVMALLRDDRTPWVWHGRT